MKYSILTFLFVSIIGCCTSDGAAKTKKNTIVNDSLTKELNEVMESGYFNGVGVAIVNAQGILYEMGLGTADATIQKRYTAHTIQNIASISKTLVGVALMKAVEMGKLRLDDPINRYLPFKVINPYYPETNITIRHLANHTSTIADNEFYLTRNYFILPGQSFTDATSTFDSSQSFMPYDSAVSMATFLSQLLTVDGKWHNKDVFLNQQPGKTYEYSNTATTLAAYIIEQATGESFTTFTRQYILKPLKMRASGWNYTEVNFANYAKLYERPGKVLPFYGMVSYPDGNFITSAHDLGLFLAELIKGYNGKGTILAKESYKELFRPQLMASNFTDRNERNPYSESYNVGIFIGFGYTGLIGHTGGDPGVASMMFFDPKTNTGRIMIVNTSFADKAGNDALYRIWEVLGKYQSRLTNE